MTAPPSIDRTGNGAGTARTGQEAMMSEETATTDPVLRLAERAFGPVVEHDGVVLVPVASVSGGGGGGSGHDEDGATGQGAGWGGTARPVGAYILEGGTVRYEPAVDLVRMVLAAQAVALAALLVVRRWIRARR